MRRFSLLLLCLALLLPSCALLPGASIPAAAQTPVPGAASSGAFTPHPLAPRPIAPVTPPAGTSASSGATTTALQSQVASLQSQNTNLQSQITSLASQLLGLENQDAALRQSLAIINGQQTALTTQNTSLSTQNTALAARVAALIGAANAPPLSFGQPWANPRTDGSGLIYAHSLLHPFNGAVVGPNGAYGTVAGWRQTFQENKAYGIDGIAADMQQSTAIETDQLTTLFQAANAENAANTVNGVIQNNGHGVTKISVLPTLDFSTLGEDTPTLNALATLLVPFLEDPACAQIGGAPVLSTYTGDGGGVSAVTSVYVPFLAQINAALHAAGKPNVLFWPGWGGSDGSTAAQEIAAVGGIGAWVFGSPDTPLGLSSPLPGQETLAASVQSYTTAAGKPALWMQGFYPLGYAKPVSNAPNAGKLYNDYGGFQALSVNMASAILTQHPFWMEGLTLDDVSEETGFGEEAASEYLPGHWNQIPPTSTPDFYQTNAGLHVAMEYWNQWYKTRQQPVIAKPLLLVSNLTQLASALSAPTNDGPAAYFHMAAGKPNAIVDEVDVDAFAPRSCQVRCSGVTVAPTTFPAPAGLSHLVFPVTQAGTPFIEMLVNGQVILQVQGHAFASTAVLANLNPASYASVPGIKFVLSVPIPQPALPVDRTGILVRATVPTFRTLGVQNFAAYDLSTPNPTLFAQNSLNDPAFLTGGPLAGGKLSASTLARADVLTEATGFDYTTLAADPLNSALGTLAYPLYFGNITETSWALAKPLPSGHVRVHCRVQKTSTDADGQGGDCLLCSTGDTYHGRGYLAEISEYQGADTLIIKAEDNVGGDSNSAGAAVLGTLALNTLALGEWYDLDFDTDGTTLMATATPGNQQTN